ncbi:hypothetical protein KKC22_06585, partial [Myxococcota bacterium]|nr:hypothetical protein [Myxococcota bacterium]
QGEGEQEYEKQEKGSLCHDLPGSGFMSTLASTSTARAGRRGHRCGRGEDGPESTLKKIRKSVNGGK